MDLEEMKNLRNKFGIQVDNFSLITKMIASYYMEFDLKYKRRFRDDIALLTTVGVLDAQIYVFQEKNITIQEIKNLAKVSLTKQNPLLEFTIGLGIIIIKIEEPDFEIEEIEYSWNSQRNRLSILIEEIKNNYPQDTYEEKLVKSHAKLFLNSTQTKGFRIEIGIKNKSWF
jgi:hypothetical protein